MFEKGSKINSILGFKCPRCHNADLFPTKILSFKGWFKMNDTCSNCGQKYTLEPGFYWGAMYIGYLLSVVLIFTFFALFFFVFGFGVDVAFLLVMAVIFFSTHLYLDCQELYGSICTFIIILILSNSIVPPI